MSVSDLEVTRPPHDLHQPGQRHPVVRPLGQQLLEVEHRRLVIILPESQVSHHHRGLLILFVVPTMYIDIFLVCENRCYFDLYLNKVMQEY